MEARLQLSLLIVAFAVGHRTCGLPSPVSDLPDSTTVQLDASALQRLKRAENCDLALPEDAERCALERLNTGLRYTALLFTGYRKPNFFSGLPHGGDDKILISALEKTLQLYDLHLSLNGSDRRGNETEDVEIRALGAVIQEIVNQTCDWIKSLGITYVSNNSEEFVCDHSHLKKLHSLLSAHRLIKEDIFDIVDLRCVNIGCGVGEYENWPNSSGINTELIQIFNNTDYLPTHTIKV